MARRGLLREAKSPLPLAGEGEGEGGQGEAVPWSLEQNLAVLAGAGVGKTYNLVTLCLHLLAGAKQGGTPLSCSELCLLTFTDKAAAELRARLRERLDRLAHQGEEVEPELSESCRSLGHPFPSREAWRRSRDDLGAATIGTFHSLCVQLLRRAPAGIGVDPAFSVLEEREAGAVQRDCAERLVLDAVERLEPEVAVLCRELGFAGDGRGKGLVDHLCEVMGKVREEGVPPLAVTVTDAHEARTAFVQAASELRGQIDSARSLLSPKLAERFGSVLSECQSALEGMTVSNFLEPGRYPALRSAVERERTLVNQRGPAGEALKLVRWRAIGQKEKGIDGLGQKYAACAVAAHERAFLSLLDGLASRYREELSRRGALDFSELLVRTRELLRDHPEARAEVQGRIRALLVDEFQDTNRLQLELVTLLSERREGAPREVGEGGVLELPLEPGFLCAVGDRKQSIYEFRGADVSVFAVLARKLESEGGRRAHLRRNFRSTPALLEFFNLTFTRLMRPLAGGKDYEVAYQPSSDDLQPVRDSSAGGPRVERLVYEPKEEDSAEDCRLADAEALARRLHALLASGELRGGDVAVLFRRFTFLETYRQALTRHGVPHRVVRGRGFYGAQEVLDVASLLALLADPGDSASFAAVLRSPLVALRDASLFGLARAGRGLSLPPLLAGRTELPSMPEAERQRLLRFLDLYPELRQERDRLGLRSLLAVALEETAFLVALSGAPFGEQALANVEKLLELAGQRDAAGTAGCAALAREVLSLADADPTEAQADVLDVQDPRAAQLLTIHQAKGLEWPVVAVPDLGARRKGGGERVAFDRELGLAIRPWLGDEVAETTPRHRAVSAEIRRREGAEHQRLLYVALTRARERLLLSGAGNAGGGTWWELLASAIAQDERLRALVRDLPASSLPKPAAPGPEAEPAGPLDLSRALELVARVRAKAPLRPSSAVLSVTQLQDFSRCPRRYFYVHLVGLSEYPLVLELDADAGEGRAGDSRFRGTVVHRLLERAPLELIGDGRLRAALEALLWEEGVDPQSAVGGELLSWAERFLASGFAAQLKSARPDRIQRELPFLLSLGQSEPDGLAVHLKGQIDLLLEDERGGALVVDYKASHRPPGGLAPYGFQLDCYSLAARRLVREGVGVRTGIAFLREKDAGPELRSAEPAEREVEQRLLFSARELLSAPRWEWAGRRKEECEAIGCGYRYRCHPS